MIHTALRTCILLLIIFIGTGDEVLYANNEKKDEFDFKKVQEALAGNLTESEKTDLTQTSSLPVQQSIQENHFLLIVRIFGWLAIVIIIIIAILLLIKQGMIGKNSRYGGGSMDIVETLPIGQGKSIILVRVMNEVYILGQTAQQMIHLRTITGEEAIELIASTRGGTSILPFKDVFQNFIYKISKKAK